MRSRSVLLTALCLALTPALARGLLFGLIGSGSTVCSECSCTDGNPYIIDCSDRQLTSAYSARDAWPANKSDVRLLFDKNSLTAVTPLPPLDVTDLSFQRNDISGISDGAFQELRRLHQLDLSHNKLTRGSFTEQTFRGQYSADDYLPLPLRMLDLSYNEIHSIFNDVFSHFASSLLELDLSHNPLPLLDHQMALTLTSLSHLRTLLLAGCGLRQLPNGLLHALITLRHLDLADNKLDHVPKDFQNSHAIKTVRLDNNPIRFLDADSFNGMVELEVINVSMMSKLEYIAEDTFSSLRMLRVLRCRNNPKLWSISPHVFRGIDTSKGIFPVKELFLNGNNLTTLSAETVPFWDQLLSLELHDNPWRCDCELQWLADLLPHWEETEARSVNKVQCHSPASLTGVALARVEGPLECTPAPPPAYIRGGSSSTLAAALVIGALVIFATAGVIGLLVWRRNKIREIYSNKLYVTSVVGAVVVLLVCVVFFWVVIAAERSGVVPRSDPLLLRLMGSFVLFLAISGVASFYVVRRQTEAARYRAKQQIRYRRAAMDEEVEVDSGSQTVTA